MPKFFFGISKTNVSPFRKGQTLFFTKEDNENFLLIATEKAWLKVDRMKMEELIIPTFDDKIKDKLKFLPNANRAANKLFNIIFRRQDAEPKKRAS